MVTALDFDAATAARAAAHRLRVDEPVLIEVWSRHGLEGTLGGFEHASVRWSHRGQATITISGHDRLAELIRSCRRQLVRIRIHYAGQVWDGRVWDSRDTGVGQDWRVTAECVGVEAILDNILAFPEARLGIEWLQISRKAIWTGPVATGLLSLIEDNASRLNRAGRHRGLPITVLRPNRLLDASPWRTWALAMEPISDVATEMLTDAQGWRLRVRQWLPGDPPPTTPWRHTTPRIVVDMVQAPWSYGVGAGHTLLSGLGRELATFLTDALAWIGQGSGRHLAKRWSERIEGTPIPSVVWQEGCAGVMDAEVHNQHPRAAAAVVGGASPDALNSLIQGGVEFGITSLLASIGVVLPGLGTVVGSMLTDRVGNYERHTNHEVLDGVGPEAMPEIFQSAGAAFSLSASQTAKTALFENAGQTFTKIHVADGMPWRLGHDYQLGDSAGWWHMDGDLYVGPVTEIDLDVSRDHGPHLATSIGTPPLIAPGAQARRIASGALTIANALTMKY